MSNDSNNKVFKTIDEQIEILKTRNLKISDVSLASNILEYENYYSVINGYKDLFVKINKSDNNDVYLDNTDFNEIYSLYKFDRELREILLIELLRVEKAIKGVTSHVFSRHYGHNHNEYLSLNSFNSKNEKNKEATEKLIKKIKKNIINYQAKHNAIKFYMEKGYIPLWVLSSILTFGELNFFYYRLNLPEKQEIANKFNLTAKDFEPLLKLLSNFRNKCAHGERVYNYAEDIRGCSKNRKKSNYITDLKYHELLKIPTNKQNVYTSGKEDVLALLIVLKYFVDKERYCNMLKKIEEAINKLSKNLKVITISPVIKKMGFVGNWLELKSL